METTIGGVVNMPADASRDRGVTANAGASKMELSWRDVDDGNALVLYVERETEAKRCLDEALRKLLYSPQFSDARYLMALLGCVSKDQITQIKQTITDRRGSRAILIVAWVGPNKDLANSLGSLLFADSTVPVRCGTGEMDNDSYTSTPRVHGKWRNRGEPQPLAHSRSWRLDQIKSLSFRRPSARV